MDFQSGKKWRSPEVETGLDLEHQFCRARILCAGPGVVDGGGWGLANRDVVDRAAAILVLYK